MIILCDILCLKFFSSYRDCLQIEIMFINVNGCTIQIQILLLLRVKLQIIRKRRKGRIHTGKVLNINYKIECFFLFLINRTK